MFVNPIASDIQIQAEIYLTLRVFFLGGGGGGSFHRAGQDDVTTGKLFPSGGECLSLYRCVLIIFKRK